MGLHETAEHGESSSGRNPLPTLDLSAAKLYMTHFQIEKNIQDDLSKDFSQSQQNLLAFFHTLYLNTTIFKSDAIAISRIMINLLEFYLKCTLPNGCPWEFKTAIPIELKGETLWRTIREMIKNGFLRKGMMGYFSETYSVLEYSNNNFSSTEAMVVPSGVEIRSDNHSRIDIKPRLMSACRRYLQQQEFVGNVSKLLIDCFAHLERFTLNGDEEQKSLVRLLDQILKRNDWALANQVLRLVTDLKELYVITCLSTMGVATFEEMLGKARKVSSESEEVICSYKELLETFAKKLASHDKGLGIPGNYFAVAGLPTRYEEQASYFILCDPAIFISQENGLNIRWPSVELKKQATDMSDRIPTQPDQALIAMRYNREYFSREFASLGASKKSALLKPHQKPAFSLL
jgi:hypothetical protein